MKDNEIWLIVECICLNFKMILLVRKIIFSGVKNYNLVKVIKFIILFLERGVDFLSKGL